MLSLDPTNETLATSEKQGRRNLQQALIMEESLLKQKARIRWLNLGDKNNKFFHLSLKSHQHKNSFGSIQNDVGNVIEDPAAIKYEAQKYFSQLFKKEQVRPPQHDVTEDFDINKTLSPDQQEMLSRPILEEEIKRTVFAMDGDKAPGPDGFNAQFYKGCWTIIGNEVTEAIRWFFINPFMPRDVNSTFLCLIPKVDVPHSFADFRPIALCNVLYKIIAKILANRLQKCVSSLVAGNQSAFIKGRNITDNILICHDIVKGIDRSSSPPIAVMKVDIHKAYDSVDRQYLMQILFKMGFPPLTMKWISACIHTPMFSILVNGSPAGYFKGDRGIRQGDPLSPYLFTMAMEPLSVMLDAAVRRRLIQIPHRCKNPPLSHLLFADDLMIFSKDSWQSIQGILSTMNLFFWYIWASGQLQQIFHHIGRNW